LPKLSADVVESWWKPDWWASLRHNATAAPDAAVPEITTVWPALDGDGDEVMVGVGGTHGVGVQQLAAPAVGGQHVV
jgi:hypothetical protein